MNQKPRSDPSAPPPRGAEWIPLTQGLFALVDQKDFKHIDQYLWHPIRSGNIMYAARSVGHGGVVLMHREVLGIRDHRRIDHKDGNGLNNRRSNLRVATNSQNQGNRRWQGKYKGVFPRGTGWIAQITQDGVRTYLGLFDTPEDAARAYNAAAREHFGEFAKLNEVKDGEPERRPRNLSSGVKGVSWHSKAGKWMAYVPGKPRVYLGLFDSVEEAAVAVKTKARQTADERRSA